MHEQAFRWVARALREHTPPTSVVEVGSLVINGSVRPLFGRTPYTGIDIRPGPGVDIVADGAAWLPAEPVDCVVCAEVLEHSPEPAAIVANAIAMLAPGGLLIITAATNPRRPHSAIHGGPLEAGEYYGNIDQNDLMEWLQAGCSEWTVEVDQEHGDVRGVGVK